MTKLMRKKFLNPLNLYNDMTRVIPHKQPMCEKILERKTSWALYDDFVLDDEMRRNLSTISADENIFYSTFVRNNSCTLKIFIEYFTL
jgi:hypothetical protein